MAIITAATLALCVAGFWVILSLGDRLSAPPALAGTWRLIPAERDPAAVDGPPVPPIQVVIEQSGQFLRVTWDGGRPFDARIEWPPADGGRRVAVLGGPSGPDERLLFDPIADPDEVRWRIDRPASDESAPRGPSDVVRFTAEAVDAAEEVSQRSAIEPGGESGHPFLLLLAQLAVVIFLSRLVGFAVTRVRQPRVIGEMIAGLMLGPSLLGWLLPGVSATLFPPESIPLLGVLAELGVVFFLFIVGLELNPQLLRSRGQAAAVISQASIAAPLLLGAAATLLLYERLFSDTFEMRFTAAALFMGAAMSITAFPVLARILIERNLHRTQVGAMAITCAAICDVSAWCLLAFVVALVRAEGLSDAVQTTLLAAGYVAAMVVLVRPFLRRIEVLHDRQGRLTAAVLAILVLLVLCSALTTAAIGIHALFGAFMAGAIMPKGHRFVREVSDRVEPFTLIVLLPIFFAFTGIKTQIGLISGAELWSMTALIVAVACLGKFGGSTVAARASGLSWRDSGALGILLNTRGLMELVILDIGRQLGVISDAIFAMMVLMAVGTTALTTPILDLVYPDRLRRVKPAQQELRRRHDSILVPISMPASAKVLALVADLISGPGSSQRRVVGLHLRRVDEHEALEAAVGEAESLSEALRDLQSSAEARSLPIEALSFIATDPATEIVQTAADCGAGLLLMGFHKPIIGTTVLGGTVHRVMEHAPCDVAVLVDRGLGDRIGSIVVPYLGSRDDRLALELASAIARSGGATVTVLHIVPPTGDSSAMPRQRRNAGEVTSRVFNDPTQSGKVTFRVMETSDPIATVLTHCAQFDLMLIGATEEWGLASQFFSLRTDRIASQCTTSMLIVRRAVGE
jgi:Kef-type K+ transport system membrane component KefB/nucleotide-binding universal stress UspA family protein